MRRNSGESSERDKYMKMIKNGRRRLREIVNCEGEVGRK
jgi:hypothetical protein